MQSVGVLHFGIALWECFYYHKSMKNKYSNKYIIETGMGLQDVDGIKNSSYFLNETTRYIKGEISLDELEQIISSYYSDKTNIEERNEEADKVSIRIAKLISEDSFTFTVGQLLSIHKSLFDNIFDKPGQLRTYNFSKREWVLNGASITYGDYRELETTLQYDFEQEKKFRYNNRSIEEIIEHLAIFIANLWQIHPFEEGNTRTVVVFFIKYLRSLGFDVTNDVFAKNAWYFRNSLVRANFTNISKGIFEERLYLINFLKNLLLEAKNQLNNKDLHINNYETSNNLKKESKIISFIKNDPKITTEELATLLGVSIRTVKNVLKSLVDNKIIKRINGKRYGYWKILNKTKNL